MPTIQNETSDPAQRNCAPLRIGHANGLKYRFEGLPLDEVSWIVANRLTATGHSRKEFDCKVYHPTHGTVDISFTVENECLVPTHIRKTTYVSDEAAFLGAASATDFRWRVQLDVGIDDYIRRDVRQYVSNWTLKGGTLVRVGASRDNGWMMKHVPTFPSFKKVHVTEYKRDGELFDVKTTEAFYPPADAFVDFLHTRRLGQPLPIPLSDFRTTRDVTLERRCGTWSKLSVTPSKDHVYSRFRRASEVYRSLV